MEGKKQTKFSVLIKTEKYRELINDTLGDRNKANLFIANISSAVSANKELSNCDPSTILSAGLQANALNLPIGGALGFAYLVPYNTKDGAQCQFQIGYKGIIQLAIRSGQYETIGTRIVHKGEYLGQNEFGEDVFKFSHEFDNEEVIGYFAYLKLLNGFIKTLYMTKNEMSKHATKYSYAYRKGYSSLWTAEFDTMALKTVLKQLISKYGIMSVDLQKAILSDQAVIKGDKFDYIDNKKEDKIVNSLKEEDAADEIIDTVNEEIGEIHENGLE